MWLLWVLCNLCLALSALDWAAAVRVTTESFDGANADAVVGTDATGRRGAADVATNGTGGREGVQIPQLVNFLSNFFGFGGAGEVATHPEWDTVRSQLTRYGAISLAVGTGDGQAFKYKGRGRSMSKVAAGGHIGIWLGATAIAGVVATGRLDFDTCVSDVFAWWSKSPKDARSRVTLRHLLTFTSGLEESGVGRHGIFSNSIDCMEAGRSNVYTTESCAHQIYDKATHAHEPGSHYDFHGFHLQIALAMVVAVTDMDARALLIKYLYDPANMTQTWFVGEQNPLIFAGIHTTGNDLDQFMHAYLEYEVVPEWVVEEMDKPTSIANYPFQGTVPEFGMSHMVSTTLPGPPPLKLSRQVNWWCGTYSWCLYLDREADLYMVVIPNSPPRSFAILALLPEVYKALDHDFPHAVEEASGG